MPSYCLQTCDQQQTISSLFPQGLPPAEIYHLMQQGNIPLARDLISECSQYMAGCTQGCESGEWIVFQSLQMMVCLERCVATSTQTTVNRTWTQPAETASTQPPAETASTQPPAETASTQPPAETASTQPPAETASTQPPAETASTQPSSCA